MRKLSVLFILMTVASFIILAFPQPAHALQWQDSRRRRAERAFLRGQGDYTAADYTKYNETGSFTDVWVAKLYREGNLIDTTSDQVKGGIFYAEQQMTKQLKDNITSENAETLLGSVCEDRLSTACQAAIEGYAKDILEKISKGQALTLEDVVAMFGNLTTNTGKTGSWCGTNCLSGFYSVSVPGSCAGGFCLVYYPLGSGPASTAKEGDVFTPGTLPGTVQARAVTMTTLPDTCDQIKAETAYRNNTSFALYLGATNQGTKTQSGSSYVSWSLSPNTYRLAALSPGSSSVRVCLTDSTGSHFGEYTTNLAASQTVTFDVAYGPPGPWFQAQGGDVYAGESITSLIPSGASPRYAVLSGSGGYPGLVQFGGGTTDYDFDAEASQGDTLISSKNWLANDALRTRDFYAYFYSKLGNPSTVTEGLPSPLTQPTYDATKKFYYLTGDITTSGDWVVADGQKYVFLIDGNLTVNGKINITGNGFIAFIVKNNITVAPSVGVAYNSTTPVVEGVYVASGAIHTGASSVAGVERFVGKGMFVGNDVKLERDLLSVSQNGAYAGELFVYNPSLLVTMPDVLRSVPVSWQEVAP